MRNLITVVMIMVIAITACGKKNKSQSETTEIAPVSAPTNTVTTLNYEGKYVCSVHYKYSQYPFSNTYDTLYSDTIIVSCVTCPSTGCTQTLSLANIVNCFNNFGGITPIRTTQNYKISCGYGDDGCSNVRLRNDSLYYWAFSYQHAYNREIGITGTRLK